MRAPLTSLVFALFAFSAGGSAQANLITNGSFESPVVASSSYANFSTASQFDATNWPLTGNLVIANGIFSTVAAQGNQWLSLQDISFGSGSITQTVSTPVGFIYELSFAYSVLRHSEQTAWMFEYNVNGTTTAKNLTTATAASPELIPWVTETYTFTPASPITTITFTGNAPVGGFYGPAIDNVVLLNVGPVPPSVPEPSTFALLGLGLAGVIARRRTT